MSKRKWVGLTLLSSIVVYGLTRDACVATGARATGVRLAAMQSSPNWRDGKFVNSLPNNEPQLWNFIKKRLSSTAQAEPTEPPPITVRQKADYDNVPSSGLRITWLGHSTYILELGNYTVLVDPVWGERASPFDWLGPKRFHEVPLAIQDLPKLDAVLISHDHYDHLDHRTIRRLGNRIPHYIVPLGVGAHLEHWGVLSERIVELDWWEKSQIGELTLTATPARHFSGRSVNNQEETLWSGWVLKTAKHNVYYSGDTAMFPEFAEIGERLGPFDVTIIETGAYSNLWPDVHIGPEQAIQAHQLLGGGLFMAAHWGTFDLALHGWTEPIERLLVAANRAGVKVVVPKPGDFVEPAFPAPVTQWWPQIPWLTAEQNPVISSGLENLPKLFSQ